MSEPDHIKIKDYQIHLPSLGDGTFGTVYRATYRSLSDRALKVFRPGAVDIVTMARELEKLSKVAEHNGIVTLHDFDLLHDPPYYTMGIHADHLPDGSWETRTLERLCGHVDYKEAWRLIREIADAVSYLHRHHIVHCDLKPSNILLTDETPHHIKICDFGQSRGLAAAGFEPVGTPLYASPEQLRSPSDSANGKGFKWDVYSFGVVAYKLLTGDLPRLQSLSSVEGGSYDPEATLTEATIEATMAETGNKLDGENLANMVEAVEEITWPDNFYIPSVRKELIEQCLSLDPAERPADMREVWNRIQERDHYRVARRARRLNAVFALLLIAAIWATIFAFIQARRAKDASEEAMVSGKQAEQLALIIIDELNQGEFSGADANKLYSLIADHSETFLANLPKNQRSETTLRFSAQTASLRGRQALERGNLDEALDKYEKSYEIRSQLGGHYLGVLAARDLMQIGRIHEQQGDYKAAEESFLKAKEWRLKDFAESESETTMQNIREFSRNYLALANLYQKTGEEKKAVETLDEIARILSESTNEVSEKEMINYQREIMPILSRMGEIEYQNGDLKGAFTAFSDLATMADQISSASPTLTEEARNHYLAATHFLGQIELDRGEKDKALLLFRNEIKLRDQIIARRPYDAELKIGLADAYQKASLCLDSEDQTARSLAIFYLEQALKLISSLPPDIRNSDINTIRLSDFKELLNLLLEKDE
ncbi:MAG: serine/threonine-protein kinase [Verrucomicrobiales bacterium]|nr:serine/threonine-protein kinase [Verrucomicrobiales bacterium]